MSSIWKPEEKLIWNRTASAPIGLYWVSDGPYKSGDWVIGSADSDHAGWAEAHGFVGRDWPLLKRISAINGDEICRSFSTISINGIAIARAKTVDFKNEILPVWSGCVRLNESQVFLLNEHEDSLDGRYFGPTKKADLVGRAHKIDLF